MDTSNNTNVNASNGASVNPDMKLHCDALVDRLIATYGKYMRDNAPNTTHEVISEAMVTAAANFMKYCVYMHVKPELHDWAVDHLCANMKDILKKSIEQEAEILKQNDAKVLGTKIEQDKDSVIQIADAQVLN